MLKIWRIIGKTSCLVGLVTAGVGIGTGLSGYILLKLNKENKNEI